MTAPHLPSDVSRPPTPRGVVPLDRDLGTVAGQRLVLLSLECWDGWADLRFARVDVAATTRLTRRVPPADAWRVSVEDHDLDVFDAVGRGDRSFSNGEVRLVPGPPDGATMRVEVTVVPGSPPLVGTVTLPDRAGEPVRPGGGPSPDPPTAGGPPAP